jgi:hypothetical protein
MGLNAGNLREGLTIAFHHVTGDVHHPDEFLQGFPEGKPRLTGALTDPGTRWIVHETFNPGIFTFECDGVGARRFLDGITASCDVGLAPDVQPPFIGTAWKVTDLPNPDMGGFDHVRLQCQGDVGECSHGFLFGFEGGVGLFPERVFHFGNPLEPRPRPAPNDHWELIVLPVGGEGGEQPGKHFPPFPNT